MKELKELLQSIANNKPIIEKLDYEKIAKIELKPDYRDNQIIFNYTIETQPGYALYSFGATMVYPKYDGVVEIKTNGALYYLKNYFGSLYSGKIYADGDYLESEITFGALVEDEQFSYLCYKVEKFGFSI